MFWKKIVLLRLLGFRVQTDLGWLVLAPFMLWALGSGIFPHFFKGFSPLSYWMLGLVGFVLLLGSFLLHELGQALVARRFGLRVTAINLSVCGGVSELNYAPPHPHAELLITIAGALVSIMLSVVAFGLAAAGQSQGWPQSVLAALKYLGIINTSIALFHLLPAFPLDGGRLLRATLWHWRANLNWATRVAADIGVFFGISFIFLGIIVLISGAIGGLWWMFIGFMLRNAAEGSYYQLRRQLQSGLNPQPGLPEPTVGLASCLPEQSGKAATANAIRPQSCRRPASDTAHKPADECPLAVLSTADRQLTV